MSFGSLTPSILSRAVWLLWVRFALLYPMNTAREYSRVPTILAESKRRGKGDAGHNQLEALWNRKGSGLGCRMLCTHTRAAQKIMCPQIHRLGVLHPAPTLARREALSTPCRRRLGRRLGRAAAAQMVTPFSAAVGSSAAPARRLRRARLRGRRRRARGCRPRQPQLVHGRRGRWRRGQLPCDEREPR